MEIAHKEYAEAYIALREELIQGGSMNKFTPGEWWIGDSYEGAREGYLGIHSPQWGALAEVCVETAQGDAIEEGEANARLISAAPEMYKALKNLLAYANAYSEEMRKSGRGAEELGPDAQYPSVGYMAREALAKADGK